MISEWWVNLQKMHVFVHYDIASTPSKKHTLNNESMISYLYDEVPESI